MGRATQHSKSRRGSLLAPISTRDENASLARSGHRPSSAYITSCSASYHMHSSTPVQSYRLNFGEATHAYDTRAEQNSDTSARAVCAHQSAEMRPMPQLVVNCCMFTAQSLTGGLKDSRIGLHTQATTDYSRQGLHRRFSSLQLCNINNAQRESAYSYIHCFTSRTDKIWIAGAS